jgi:hypothetical protein
MGTDVAFYRKRMISLLAIRLVVRHIGSKAAGEELHKSIDVTQYLCRDHSFLVKKREAVAFPETVEERSIVLKIHIFRRVHNGKKKKGERGRRMSEASLPTENFPLLTDFSVMVQKIPKILVQQKKKSGTFFNMLSVTFRTRVSF